MKKFIPPSSAASSSVAALTCLLLLFSLFPCHSTCARAEETVEPAPTPESMWERVQEAVENKDTEKSAALALKLHHKFPQTDLGAESLWYAAGVRQEMMARSDNPDWEAVRDLYRRFIEYYPKSPLIPEAYLNVGICYYRMHFFREALTYFNLFQKRFPQSPLFPKSQYWQGQVQVAIGHYDEAWKIFNELKESEDWEIKKLGLESIGDLYAAQGNYNEAIAVYLKLTRGKKDFYLDTPELLRTLGVAQVKAGRTEEGRKNLFHYLNIEQDPYNRSEVLYLLGESYRREGYDEAAQKMYAQVVELQAEEFRYHILSQMRIQQYLDNPGRALSKWSIPNDLTDEKGDEIYLEVLDRYYDESYGQIARQALFARYKARDDFENAYIQGKNYLHHANLEEQEQVQKSREILLYLLEKLIAKEDYQRVYDLYAGEYRHIKDFPNGKPLFLVGQAMEALHLYDQAAVVYYRAMKWPLDDKDKADLYFRRAHVYLVKGDLASAERLLKYLRKIYAGEKEQGHIAYLSGRLREAQMKDDEAYEFYTQAVAKPTFDDLEQKQTYAKSVLRLGMRLKKIDDMQAYLGQFSQSEQPWLRKEDLQSWFVELGDYSLSQNRFADAEELYIRALDEASSMPQEGKIAQMARLHLGDALMAQGKKQDGIAAYNEAVQGADSIVSQMAKERLNQHNISQQLEALQE